MGRRAGILQFICFKAFISASSSQITQQTKQNMWHMWQCSAEVSKRQRCCHLARFFFILWVEWEVVRISPTYVPLYRSRMTDTWMGHSQNDNWVRKTKLLWEEPALVPLCPPQISHELPWNWVRAFAERNRQLTVSTTARDTLYCAILYLQILFPPPRKHTLQISVVSRCFVK
jgi:hypothetical protein